MTVAMYRCRDESARRGGILTRPLPQSHAVDRLCVGNVVRTADRQIRRDITHPWVTRMGRPWRRRMMKGSLFVRGVGGRTRPGAPSATGADDLSCRRAAACG